MPDRLLDLEHRLEQAAHRHWTYRLTQLGRPELPFWRVQVPPRGRLQARVCLASGIHGDEPAGLEAMLRLLEAGAFPHGVAVDCFPCMNPAGFCEGTRDDHGQDLNRQFGAFSPPEPVKWFLAAIDGVTYDMYIDLHEDSRAEGFYLFEAPTQPGHGVSTVKTEHLAAEVASEVTRAGFRLEETGHLKAMMEEDGFDAFGPIHLEPGVAVPTFTDLPSGGLPQAVYMRACRDAHVLTFETPAEREFEARVAMHMAGIRAVFGRLQAKSRFAPLNPAREWMASEPTRRRK